MKDSITLTTKKSITIDLKAERVRIKTPRMFNTKQRKVLLKAIDLFEEGNIQDMIDLVQADDTTKLFNYNVWEYFAEAIYTIVGDISNRNIVYSKEV